MTLRMYKAGKTAILSGDIDMVNDPISAMLVDLGAYTPDTLTDATLADIPDAANLSECLLTGKMLTDGSSADVVVLDADDTVFPSVESGHTGEAIVVFLDNENVGETRLICIIDDADGLPATTTGDDIIVTWSSSGILGV